MYICIYVYMYVCMYVCMYIFECVYIRLHIHTNTHTHTHICITHTIQLDVRARSGAWTSTPSSSTCVWASARPSRDSPRCLKEIYITLRWIMSLVRTMRSMRGGFIFRNRGPSLKVHYSQDSTVTLRTNENLSNMERHFFGAYASEVGPCLCKHLVALRKMSKLKTTEDFVC